MAKSKQINVLLRLKRQQEDRAYARFVLAKNKVETLRSHIHGLEAALIEQDRSVRRQIVEASGARQLSAAMERYRQETAQLREALAEDNALLVAARQTLTEARLEMLESLAKRQGLEQLAQQTQARCLKDQQRRDIGELDQLHQVSVTAARVSQMSGT